MAHTTLNTTLMLTTALKIALRNFQKNRLYTLINISGLAVGLAVWSRLERSQELAFPEETMIGALMAYISKEEGDRRLEPMNANFGLLPPLKEEIRDKRLKKEALAARALAVLREFQEGL